MLEQLKELLEMQRVLDESIFKAKGITKYPLENMRIALFVELGEFLNEMPTQFKHWKSSAVDDREKALEEYVDCLHFALSLSNQRNILINKIAPSYEQLKYIKSQNDLIDNLSYIMSNNCEFHFLECLFGIGNYFGFAWEEIYNAYKEKNKVNYERLKNGY